MKKIEYVKIVQLILSTSIFGNLSLIMISIFINFMRFRNNLPGIVFRFYHENWLLNDHNDYDKIEITLEKINKESFEYQCKHNITTVEEITKVVQDIDEKVISDFYIENIYLFGSYAKKKKTDIVI